MAIQGLVDSAGSMEEMEIADIPALVALAELTAIVDTLVLVVSVV